MKLIRFFFCLFCLSVGLIFHLPALVSAQSPEITAGPYLFQPTKNTAQVWFLTRNTTEFTAKFYNQPALPGKELRFEYDSPWKGYRPAMLTFENLPIGRHPLLIEAKNEKKSVLDTVFIEITAPAKGETWSFITGSCAFKEFGAKSILKFGSPKIFTKMASEPTDFMLWLGDNVYYLNGEWNSVNRMMKKQIRMRLMPEIQSLLASMPQYSIWDDHDYGPNNSNGSFTNKNAALSVSELFWGNPGHKTGATQADGEETVGNFGKFSRGEVDFFLLDCRYYRGEENAEDAFMLGPDQLEWLKEALRTSTATFKIVVSGSQVINELNPGETWAHFPKEREAFFSFLRDEKINGVLFITGDRHFTEMQKRERPGLYPLYDFTCSPMTSFLNPKGGHEPESGNPERIPNTFVKVHNYGVLTFSGSGPESSVTIRVKDKEGIVLWEERVEARDLRVK